MDEDTYELGGFANLVIDGTEVVVIQVASRVNCYQVQFDDGVIDWYHEDELK